MGRADDESRGSIQRLFELPRPRLQALECATPRTRLLRVLGDAALYVLSSFRQRHLWHGKRVGRIPTERRREMRYHASSTAAARPGVLDQQCSAPPELTGMVNVRPSSGSCRAFVSRAAGRRRITRTKSSESGTGQYAGHSLQLVGAQKAMRIAQSGSEQGGSERDCRGEEALRRGGAAYGRTAVEFGGRWC